MGDEANALAVERATAVTITTTSVVPAAAASRVATRNAAPAKGSSGQWGLLFVLMPALRLVLVLAVILVLVLVPVHMMLDALRLRCCFMMFSLALVFQ